MVYRIQCSRIIRVRILLSGNCHGISADCAFDIHEVLRLFPQNETFARQRNTRHVAFTKNFFPKSLRRVEEEMYHKLRNNIKRQEYNNFK